MLKDLVMRAEVVEQDGQNSPCFSGMVLTLCKLLNREQDKSCVETLLIAVLTRRGDIWVAVVYVG